MKTDKPKKYDILRKISHELYTNSRVSISELVNKLNLSHRAVSKYLQELEENNSLYYTLDLDPCLLGFTEPKLIAIKFSHPPKITLLKKRFKNDKSVQNAYFGSGDFDLIVHLVCKNQNAYIAWLFQFRVEFSNYKPIVKVSSLNDNAEGFLPLRADLIMGSTEITDAEKLVLFELIKNSRIKLKELQAITNLTQMKTIYSMDKLHKRGIIRRFTTCIQNPNAKLFAFLSLTLIPTEDHKPHLQTQLINKIIESENSEPLQLTTNYSVIYDTAGTFDSIFFCSFKDAADMDENGPSVFEKIWESEYPKFERCILTDLIVGKWPFNSNGYTKWREVLKPGTLHTIKAYV